MAGRIAGITIKIGANTSELQKSLKGLDSTLKKTQSNLKDVNRLLKFDPGNTQLLTQKQKGLETAIKGTRLRVNELKTALEGVAEGSEEWDAIQREIIATEQELQRLETEYRNFGSVGAQQVAAVGAKMQEAGEKIAGVGKKLTTAVTLPIVGGFAAAVKATADFDSAMSQVAATMGTTTDQIQELRDFAIQMGASTAFSATEAAEALNYMALAGYDADTSMQMLPTVLDLAASGGIALASASDMVTDAQSALGLSLEETAAMVDQMAAASSKSNTSVSQLGEAFLKIGATARSVSGGTQELATVLGVLADNGIKGAEGGTHLRNILLSLQSSASEGQVMFGDLAVSVYDAEGNLRSMVDIIADVQGGLGGMSQESKDAILSGVFNKTDLAAVNALLSTTADRFDELGAAIGESGGAAKQMAGTQLDNLQGDITLLKSAVEGLAISFGSILVPNLRKGADWLQKLIDKFNRLAPETKETIVKIAGVAAALGPVLVAGGKLISTAGKVLKTAPKIVTAVKAVSAALSPTVLVIAAVAAAAVALGVLIYKNWDKIVAWTKDMAAKVKAAWEKAKSAVVTAANGLRDGAVKAWNALKSSVTTAAENIRGSVSNAWNNLKTNVVASVAGLKSSVLSTWAGIKSSVAATASEIYANVVSKFNSVKSAAASIWDGIKNSISTAINGARDTVSTAIDKIKGFLNFEWTLPKLKLPHIKLTAGQWPWGIMGKGVVPTVSIDWYRRAYENPVLFSNPTVLATPGGYKGFGDGNGAEIVMGLNKLRELVGSSGSTVINVYPPQGADTEAIAAAVEQRLVAAQRRRMRVYA